MKKSLLIAIVALMMQSKLYATHLMGGQITATHVSGLTYDIKMTLYRDTVGIPIATTDNIFVWDAATSTQLAMLAIPAAPAVQFGNGVEEYVYDTVYTFPANGDYILSWVNCCRNGAIQNLPTPLNNGMFLSTQVMVDGANSTPVFLNPPIPVAQINVPFYYNPLPFDPDGDSLVWSLDTPYDCPSTALPDPATAFSIPGYTLPPTDISMPFTMDAVTGQISFLPNTLGHFVLSVIAAEYRNGLQIGFIRRDMQIIVLTPSNLNHPPVFSDESNVQVSSDRSYRIFADSKFSLTLKANDADNNFVSTTANGEPFHVANPATLSSNDGYTHASAVFNWTPDLSRVRSQPYIISIRTAEHSGHYIFYQDHTYALRVINPEPVTSYDLPQTFDFSIAEQNGKNFTLNLSMPKSMPVTITLSDASGKKADVIYDATANSGTNTISFTNKHFASGIYFITVKWQDGIKTKTRKIKL